jgi:hypothetical protein
MSQRAVKLLVDGSNLVENDEHIGTILSR